MWGWILGARPILGTSTTGSASCTGEVRQAQHQQQAWSQALVSVLFGALLVWEF